MSDDVTEAEEPLDDDASPVAESPARMQERAEAERQALRTPPMNEREAADDSSTPAASLEALTTMTRMRPFLYLFVAYANVRYSRRQSVASRVDALAMECPRFYWCCKVLDVLFLVGVCLMLMGLVGVNIYHLAN